MHPVPHLEGLGTSFQHRNGIGESNALHCPGRMGDGHAGTELRASNAFNLLLSLTPCSILVLLFAETHLPGTSATAAC